MYTREIYTNTAKLWKRQTGKNTEN